MTPIGHCLMGLSVASLTIPPGWGWRTKLAGLAVLAAAANVPDLPLPYWGRPYHHVSHSVFVTLGLMAAQAAVLSCLPGLRRKVGGWTFAGAFMLSWASHLLLDSFYGHSEGARIYWPMSEATLSLPIPWLDGVSDRLPWSDAMVLRVVGIELLFFGTILALCLAARAMALRRSRSNRVALDCDSKP